MKNQISIFSDGNINIEKKIDNIFSKISVGFNYKNNIFSIQKNYSKKGSTAGNLISTEIDINEESYPYDPQNKISKTTQVFLIYPNLNGYEIRITHSMFNDIKKPSTAKIIKSATTKYRFDHILFSFSDEAFLKFIEDILIYSLKNYNSSNSFGCCSKYKECSEQKMCLHPNKLYAKGCKYRKNLEKGIIFY